MPSQRPSAIAMDLLVGEELPQRLAVRERAGRVVEFDGGDEGDQLEAPLVHRAPDLGQQLAPARQHLRAVAEHLGVVRYVAPGSLLPLVHRGHRAVGCFRGVVSMKAMGSAPAGIPAVVMDLDFLADVGVVAGGAQAAEFAPADAPVRRPAASRVTVRRQRLVGGLVRGVQEERDAVALPRRVRRARGAARPCIGRWTTPATMSPRLTTSASRRGSTRCQRPSRRTSRPGCSSCSSTRQRAGVGVLADAERPLLGVAGALERVPG